jgi:hypothetical protein
MTNDFEKFTIEEWVEVTKSKILVNSDGNAFAVANGISEYQVFPRKEGKDLPKGTTAIKWFNV